ncbi:hypothetical protein AX17_004479 [Amanita inopinata Kibby_2008]|nr:hypothetical protein AX17_004479 [Amanita inopinata Kibby_2008]
MLKWVWDQPLKENSTKFAQHCGLEHVAFGECIGSDDDPLEIEDVEPHEFDRFLGVLYPPYSFGSPSFFADYSLNDWLSVLNVATTWEFASVRNIALYNIHSMCPSHTDIVILSEHFPLPSRWRFDALACLCGREEPLSAKEGRKLGIDLTVLIFTAREILGEDGRSRASDVEHVVNEIFDIFDIPFNLDE